MIGRRLPDYHDVYDIPLLAPGEYIRIVRPEKKDLWFAQSLDGEDGNLSSHSITVNEDGTITVSPSIWFNTPTGWHGFLEHGVWRRV